MARRRPRAPRRPATRAPAARPPARPPSSSSPLPTPRCSPSISAAQVKRRSCAGPSHLDDRVDDLLADPGELLLQLGLVVDRVRRGVLDLPAERLDDRRLDAPRSPCSRKIAASAASSSAASTLRFVARRVSSSGCAVEPALEQLGAEPELLRDERAGAPRDDVRADLRQPALGQVGVAVVQMPCDGQLEHAVAEELEPLVRRRPVGRPRRVGEDVLEPVRRQRADQLGEPPNVACLRVAATGASRRSRRPVRRS